MAERIDVRFAAADINSQTGIFSGYGAVFGNLDSHKDIIMNGAFKASLAAWRAKGRLPRMLLMHGSSGNPFTGDDLPIGVWTAMREDAKGLYVEGQLLALNTDYGRRILSLMQGGALDGLSIGYVVKRSSAGSGTAKRFLEAIDLREVSIVDEPSNDLARVATIKDSLVAVDLEGAYAKMQKALRAMAVTPANDNGLDGLAGRIRALARR
ncbi:HK97 family phage prohead protease [Mesorhizobium sp. M4A.F.Ca.ET.020.02.1.1]|uniref:HK97 family phage prohead protease n=1 Tax=unclassified Mesorhizobium TaxID=325217 RepID=UPI000FD2D6E4|nr:MULTISPECIES: HK97 family phage prohead protease [unclassified Mesorhizobium]RVD38553.1 HK97 family phage prohead protease [Mesorhizobium sp. M4A.F.Ca.ET.020.02.1.1]RWC10912.1 MAG: HK97 family phage prohead protease [Mesorhizobium sp.]